MARKKRKTRRLKGSYKKKYETLLRRKGVREKVALVKKIYKLKTLSPKEIRDLDSGKRKEYYKLQYRVASGNFEANKRKVFRENYIKYLESIGVSNTTLAMAKRLLRRRDLDTVSHELDAISGSIELTPTGRTLKDDMRDLLPVRFYDISRDEGSVQVLEENIKSLYINKYDEYIDEDKDGKLVSKKLNSNKIV